MHTSAPITRATYFKVLKIFKLHLTFSSLSTNMYTLSEAWSEVNWADLMLPRAPSGPIFMQGLYSVQSIVPTIVLVDLS